MIQHLLRFTPRLLLYKPHSLLLQQHRFLHYHMDPTGTIIFSTIGRPFYGFDVFSLNLTSLTELRLTDAVSINFNAQFLHNTNNSIVFISERSGSPKIYLTSPNHHPDPLPLPSAPTSLFHDRPIISNDKRLYFISAHQHPGRNFKSWSTLYTTTINNNNNNNKSELITRLTPAGSVDYSPSVSPSGNLIAVASYGNGPWEGEFCELHTRVVVFLLSEPDHRLVVSDRGGWPTWGDDSTVFFHRQAEDGWWSIFRVEFNFRDRTSAVPERVTPPGVHCFTPAAFRDGRRVAVATRRRGKDYRHIEIFNLETERFESVTELINPNFHHYNPFVSSDSEFLGYHRFRGDSDESNELIVPHLEPIGSPEKNLRLLRINGSFPTFSPRGDFVAFNPDFAANAGLKVVRSDGSKSWTLIKGRTAFHNSWSPKEEGVIFTSVGPIFESSRTAVQIARVSFDPLDLTEDREEVTCEVKMLTWEDTGNNAFPACSPDGRFVVFRSGRNGDKNLYVMDAVNGEFDGGSIRQLTHGACIDTMPSWSPNGDLIAFSSNRHDPSDANCFSIYLVRSDGSDLRRVYLGDVDRERVNHVCFSADGEWLLFTCNFGGVSAEPVSWPNQFQPYGDLYSARLDGSGLRRLTWNAYENGTPAWHPGGETDLGRIKLGDGVGGDRLTGQFVEPLWISCDI